MSQHNKKLLRAKLVQLKSDGHYTVATLSLDAIKAVIVLLLVWLKIGSDKDV